MELVRKHIQYSFTITHTIFVFAYLIGNNEWNIFHPTQMFDAQAIWFFFFLFSHKVNNIRFKIYVYNDKLHRLSHGDKLISVAEHLVTPTR